MRPEAFHGVGVDEAAGHGRLVGPAHAGRSRRGGPRFRRAVRAGAGTLATAVAMVAFEGAPSRSDADPARPLVRSEAVELLGLTAQRVHRVTYEPRAIAVPSLDGQIVGVAVLSGTLTVYGPAGERRLYVAGDGYAAGWTAYRMVNETDDTVEALITIHEPAAPRLRALPP